MTSLLITSILTAAVGTVPFLVGYQAATLSDAHGNELGTVFVASYTQAYEAELPQEERAPFRDLLERVKRQYGDSDLRGRALMALEYLGFASLDRFGDCAEVVLKLEHYTGVRYRVCVSPHQDVVRLVEDLTTPQRVFWSITTPDPEVQEQVNAVVRSTMEELDAAAGDPERIAELQAGIQSKIRKISEEAGPGRTAYNVHEIEVNGGWEEVTVSDTEQVEEILLKLMAGGSPEFSSRFTRLVCFLTGLRDGRFSDLDEVIASDYPLVLDGLEFDSVALPVSCSFADQKLEVVSGSVDGPLSRRFLRVPDSVAKEYCADGKWDPPEVGLSFEKRVERLRSGRGW